MKGHIINPATGRWVLRQGTIGRNLIRMSRFTDEPLPLVRSMGRYKKITRLWDWWARVGDKERDRIGEALVRKGKWDPSLNDQAPWLEQEKGYPVYIMSYGPVLRTAWKNRIS